MKFLCDNCKAKYQIPDEKIRGRTLKMKCRKCEHPILIQGPQGTAGPKAPAARRGGSSVKPAPRRRGGSSVGPRPTGRPASASALRAEFRRGGSLAPEPEPRRPAVEWYAAINDVPVGPIKRDELARKIGTGAVHAKSLCWREGMDDWKPLEQVPELASLLASRRVPAPPPRPAAGARTAARPPPEKEPSGRSNVVPIGGRMGAGATPGFDDEDEKTVIAASPAGAVAPAPSPDLSPLPIAEPQDAGAFVAAPTAEPSSPSPPSAPSQPAQPAARGLPPPLLIALVGAGAFGIALAVIAGQKLFADDPPPQVAANDPLDGQEPPIPDLELDEPEVELELPPDQAEADEADEAEADEAETTDTPAATTMRRTTTTTMATSRMSDTSEMLTAAQRELLERFGGNDTTAGPSLMSVNVGGSGRSGRQQLDASAVRRVVSAPTNQRALRRCYETAIRGASDAPSVRMDISVRVGASGTVTRVSASGNDFNGLRACLERTVRRWRFPPSSAGGETRFPVVFSPAG